MQSRQTLTNDCGHIVHGSKNMQFFLNNKKSNYPGCKKKVLSAKNMAKHICKSKQDKRSL